MDPFRRLPARRVGARHTIDDRDLGLLESAATRRLTETDCWCISVTLKAPGSEAPARTPTACSANTSPKATSPDTPPRNSKQSPPRSTADTQDPRLAHARRSPRRASTIPSKANRCEHRLNPPRLPWSLCTTAVLGLAIADRHSQRTHHERRLAGCRSTSPQRCGNTHRGRRSSRAFPPSLGAR